jgi:cation transport ATPase
MNSMITVLQENESSDAVLVLAASLGASSSHPVSRALAQLLPRDHYLPLEAGSDIALASADVVLIGSDLRRLGTCVRLSRACRRTLKINVFIGVGGVLIAALLHNLSTLLVLGNAGRLLRFDEPL